VLPEIGALIGGKYKVERRIGEGGMAVVFEVSTYDGQRLAMKMLKPEVAKSQEVVTRFYREARAVRKLRSPHAVRVMDAAVTPEGVPYMVMEFLVGRDLSAELEKNGPLPIVEAVGYIIQACVAIREAHHRRIVHRDLKPDNLFLVRERDATLIKVLDFGVSKVQDELVDMTGTQTVMGTPYYMSPEQIRSTKTADARSDLFSLGVILYELLTGKVPFDGDGNLGFVMVSICIHPVPPMREKRPEISPELEKAILHALEKDRDQRVQTAEEMMRELSRAAGLPMPPLELLGSQPEISVSITTSAIIPVKKPALRWELIALAIAVPVFFLVVIGLVLAIHYRASGKPAASASAVASATAPPPPPPPPPPSTVIPVLAVSTTPSAATSIEPPVPSATTSAPRIKPTATAAPDILSKRR
jgi:serine/threonine-protein kinase